MTDDLDSADHTPEKDDTKFSDKSKRGRFKDVLTRTKFKITEKVREEKEARKSSSHSDRDSQSSPFEDSVNAFLAAGRATAGSSSQPSIHPDTLPSETSLLPTHSKPPTRVSIPTSNSTPQSSPRRIQIPRIDVSASQRFPAAKEIVDNVPVQLRGSSPLSGATLGSSLLLQPEFKPRSQSASSFASTSRKARIRNLSVGFADAPPVVIGEGGDAAEAPPVEISRAKMSRARSASPQPRILRSAIHLPPVTARQTFARDRIEESVDIFNPKPVSRVQTGSLSPGPISNIPHPEYDNFMPKPFARQQTGFSDSSSPVHVQRRSPLPANPKPFILADLGKSQKVTSDRTREFEMSLGLGAGSPTTNKPSSIQGPHIFAPKPQRAAPSYDLIEGGGRETLHEDAIGSPLTQGRPRPSQPPSEVQPQPREQTMQRLTLEKSHRQTPLIHELPALQVQTNPSSPQQLIVHPQTDIRPQVMQAPPTTIFVPGSATAPLQVEMQQTLESNIRHRPPLAQRFLPPPTQGHSELSELPAKGVPSQNTSEQDEHNHPEFENFLRLSMLQDQDQDQRPSPTISRFASLHPSATRPGPILPRQHFSWEQEQTSFPEQPSIASSCMISPIDTGNNPGPAKRSKPVAQPDSRPISRPISTVSSSAIGSPRVSNLQRISPSGQYGSSPTTYSPIVGPTSAAESPSSRMRFYESVNKGHAPAGYI